MTNLSAIHLTEDELDTLVSIAIRRAEVLDDIRSPAASDAWHEVMSYEARLAAITSPSGLPGGVARVGAIRAALAAGSQAEAARLSAQYLAEEALPSERRTAVEAAFKQHDAGLAKRFPALAKRGRLAEVRSLRTMMRSHPHVFPCAA